MRGLKRYIGYGRNAGSVASFTDAWIETVTYRCAKKIVESHLLQMRGLKQNLGGSLQSVSVASFTDAWIETFEIEKGSDRLRVASFTDAWIET